MDNQKDINKEVLKSDEEKVEDLAKDAEDLEKAVEEDIEDKVEKVEEVNDAKAEPLDAKDGSGKAVKDVVASDKEFKEEQEHEDVEFPEVKKSEFVTEKLKPFTEKLELNEAAETQTEIKELLSDYLLQELEESEFMDNLAWRAEKEVSGYNHDWCAEEASSDYKEKEYEFIDELVEDLMANCPLEESLKENKLNESDEDNKTNIRDLKDFSWKELEGLKGKTIRALKNIEYGEVLDFDEEDMPNFKKAGLRARRSGDIIIPKGWQGEIVYTYSHEGINPELGIEVNDEYIPLAIAGGKAGEFGIIDNIGSLKESKLNESDRDDLRNDANSLSDYLSKNKLYCDLEDYEMYPLGVKVVTFRVEGDWKHDHLYFEDLVEGWAKENGKEIWKTDENVVEEDGSDYYTADHKVYITDKETSDRLNSMRGLFAPKEESLKEDLMSSSWGSNFQSDVYNALADIAFKYYKKDINITEDDWSEAIEWFMTHFFEDEQIYDESLKEDLMGTAWGSNFKSDVYNALSKIAFKYYRKDINVTDDDWNDAIEWFMTHFFESDDNPFYESLKEAVSPDLINAIMWNYGCSKTEASKKAKSMDEERKKLLIQGFKDNAKKSFYSESLKEDVELWDSDRVVDLARYYAKKYPYTEDEKIIKAIIKTMQKQGATLPSDLKEVEKVYYATIDEDNDYDAEYGEPYDESLDESKLDEAIPREVAQALKNSSGQEIKNSGGAYYRIPGSTDGKYSYNDPKTALDNSKVDYANAEFNKISKEEAINIFKTEPQNLLLIVKDYGRNSDKAIWFDENGNRSGRVENVPLDIAPVRRDGTAIRDTKYMTPKQLIGCASACYWTNQREVLRDPDVEKERRQNPESKYYSGDSVSDVIKATSPEYRDRYGISNSSYRGVEMPSSYNWRPYNEREYKRIKTDLNTWQTKLDSGELSADDKHYALRKIDDLENKLKELEKNRSKYYNDIKDYKANLRNLTMLKSKDYLKKLLDLRAKVKDSDDELRHAEARLVTVRNQGGTWSNSYDRRQVTRYEAQIEELKAQIARYQKYIEDLNAKLNSEQVSEEDAREIANAEADVNRIKSEIEDSKNELDAVLNRARARRQQNTESLEEDLKVTVDFASFEPWGRAEDTYNRIKDAGKLDEADAILEELYPEGISEDSLNAILAHEPEWLLNELGLADEEEVAMLDLDEE